MREVDLSFSAIKKGLKDISRPNDTCLPTAIMTGNGDIPNLAMQPGDEGAHFRRALRID